MIALPLIDALLSKTSITTANPQHGLAVEEAGKWIERMADVLLREFDILDGVDRVPQPEEEAFDRTFAELIHGAYEKWCHEADALLGRIQRVERRGRSIAAADHLRDCFGRTMAMLQVTLDACDESAAQTRAGQGYTLEEVRNDVRALVCAESATRTGGAEPDLAGRVAGRDRVAG